MSDTCVHVGCFKVQRARRLCEKHYQQLKRAGLAPLNRKMPERATGIRLEAQLGRNPSCVDCGGEPWHGGMRCWPHFKQRVRDREEEVRRTSQPHTCDVHDPSVTCYIGHGCRCHGCRQAKADDAADRREVA